MDLKLSHVIYMCHRWLSHAMPMMALGSGRAGGRARWVALNHLKIVCVKLLKDNPRLRWTSFI